MRAPSLGALLSAAALMGCYLPSTFIAADAVDGASDGRTDGSTDGTVDSPADIPVGPDVADSVDVPDVPDVPIDVPCPADDATCNPPAPRPTAPMSTTTVTSQQPTLSWALAPGTTGVHVQLCHDRACTMVIASFDASGTSARPPAPLTRGVVFWKLFGRNATFTGTAASPTWEFMVGGRDAPVGTAMGTWLDVDGNGITDVAVGAPGTGTANGAVGLYLHATSTTPDAMLLGLATSSLFGHSVASAGDVNGDGYGDLIVGAPGAFSNRGQALVYMGGPSGIGPNAVATLMALPAITGMGISVAGVGDVDGDGYGDIIVGASQGTTPSAFLFRGSPTGTLTTAANTLTGNSSYGAAVSGAGDVNGDGFADVLVGSPSTDFAYLYYGGPNGLAMTAATSVTLFSPAGVGGQFGIAVGGGGDVNGDGYGDIVIGASTAISGHGRAYVYLGGSSGLNSTPTELTGPDVNLGAFGVSASLGGDMDGGGYGDVVIGASGLASGTGAAYLYNGGMTGIATMQEATFVGPAGTGGQFAAALSLGGDITGDGRADLVVGASGVMTSAGAAYVFASTMGVPATTPSATLAGPIMGNGLAGSSVAWCPVGHDRGLYARLMLGSANRARAAFDPFADD